MNAFQSGARKNIPAVLIYAHANWAGSRRWLMIHRNARDAKADIHAGKYNGLGGKTEPDESPQETARREFQEEAGLDLPLDAFRPLGFLNFPLFKPTRSEDWSVSVFTVALSETQASTVVSQNPEGSLEWIDQGRLLELPLWEGDHHFIPYVLRQEPFLGAFWYVDGRLARHAICGIATSDTSRRSGP